MYKLMNADFSRLYLRVSALICGPTFLSILRVGGAVGGELFFILVADGEQLILVNHVFATVLEMKLENPGLDDGVHGAGCLAEPAVNALEQVDVVTRGAARAVGAHPRFDRDRPRPAHRLAQLAGNAALLAVGIAAQGVQAAEPRAHRRALLRILHRELAHEQMTPGHHESLQQLIEQECIQITFDRLEHCIPSSTQWKINPQGVRNMTPPMTPIHTSVTGMNTFHPRRMIWS